MDFERQLKVLASAGKIKFNQENSKTPVKNSEKIKERVENKLDYKYVSQSADKKTHTSNLGYEGHLLHSKQEELNSIYGKNQLISY